jgi:CheY-like chemotaxis protein
MDGLQVCAFTDPIEAFNQLQHTLEGYAVIISDYTMPSMNYVEICTKLLTLNSKLKIIIISVYQDIEYNTSRFMFLHKPITIAHLLKAVKKYLTE